jgi:organic radical activating enzyme
MFKYLRVQILYPCRARCAWCSTHRKNALFHHLWKSGIAHRIHRFYVEAIQLLQPTQVFLSGGEPILYPDIAQFLNDIKDWTHQINLFTSFQFPTEECDRISFAEMPLEKVVFSHTPIDFDPDRWSSHVGTFPFDVYVENLRRFKAVPARKRLKFIINRETCAEQIQRFQDLVQPDETFEFGLKTINDQGNGLCADTMKETSGLVAERVARLSELATEMGWNLGRVMEGSLDVMGPILEDGDVTRCGYRNEPLEIRFALEYATEERQVLRYRYCPSFPPDFGHRFHVGRDDPRKLERNFTRGPFRDHCSRCRFLKYWDAKREKVPASVPSS